MPSSIADTGTCSASPGDRITARWCDFDRSIDWCDRRDHVRVQGVFFAVCFKAFSLPSASRRFLCRLPKDSRDVRRIVPPTRFRKIAGLAVIVFGKLA
jgi:hypothetical protein